MKMFYTVVWVMIMLLTSTGHASADGPVGIDCTDPPNLVPFADLRNCDLSGRQMPGINLYDADLSGANLSSANLSGANLGGAEMIGTNFSDANLDNADLFTSELIGAIFDYASLRNTNLDDAYAPGGSFINADLRGANFHFATMSDANLSGANLSNSSLGIYTFERSILQNANFSGSGISGDMRSTDLRGADLSFTTLWYLSLSNSDLRNANLLGARLKEGTSLDGILWGNTTCSDGSNSDDNDGDNFTCESNFLVNQPPTVSLASPANNTTVTKGATVNISANAADSDGSVIRVEFYVGSTLLNMDIVAPYSFNWTTTATGTYAITARAYDTDSAVTTSQPVTVNVLPSPNNAPPTVSITSPANNATVYRLLGTTIRANAGDSDGSITKVEFYAGSTLLGTDTSAPYSFFWRPASLGNFTLTARAYDNNGAVKTSTPVTIRVK
ncbi:MAG TPA: pentapeptide repeat-containing protein [Anaerolineales bacterium]|nr:pentapeptide repeat-containing protein [Anaerolineales bacterium]